MNEKFPQFYKPVIPRPQFHVFGQNNTTIRGSTGRRCQWCSALLKLDDEICPRCNATQIDVGLLDLTSAPAWKQRIKNLGGNPNRGYTGI